MKRTPVTSSNIATVGYDEPSKILEVEFKSGAVYQYLDVPPQTHAGLMAAESQGKFLNAVIKNKFGFVNVSAAA